MCNFSLLSTPPLRLRRAVRADKTHNGLQKYCLFF